MAGTGDSDARAAASGGLLRELAADGPALFGVAVLVLLLTVAVFAPALAPYEPAAQALRDRLQPPVWQEGGTWAHLLGTDHLGRDMLSRLIWGSRVSLAVGAAVVVLAGALGVAVGLAAGYYGGRIDAVLMRFVDTLLAFPGFLLALVILAVVGPSMWSVIAVLGLTGWMVYARMTRGIVLSVRQLPYVDAAEMIGARPGRVIFRHILPNLVSPLVTLAILEFANVVLAEAALSFLGLGIQPPQPSWGSIMSAGRQYVERAWWITVFPGAFLFLLVFSVNVFGDWLRDRLDPRSRSR
jgi:peptide/nickel transport system permease protein